LNPVVSTLLPAGLAFIMFALGTKLSVADFRRVLTYPVAVSLGLIAQTLLLPLTAFAIAKLFGLAPETAVGLMILAACPGGVTAAVITDLARGDTCLSITLTACTSLLSFITVPIIVGFSLAHFLGAATPVDYPVGQAIGGLFLITLVPVAAGLLFNQAGWLTVAIARATGRLATIVFLVIVFLTFFTEWPNITAHFATVGPAILLLNVSSLV
jgi:BASS family bile acid:Na+ symporter